jgi:hypothetical protein
MKPSSRVFARHLLPVAIAGVLALPLAAHAREPSKQQQLEARIAQLEAELAAIRDEMHEQKRTVEQVAQQQAAVPPPPPPPAAPPEPPKATFTTGTGMNVALHGFISATAFSQNKSFTFGNGQNAEYPVVGSSGTLSGFDIRNTRFWLDFAGAQFNDSWSGGGRIEMDFFGGFNGTGAYSHQQPIPRLRQGYMDLVNADSGSRVRVGQQWDLMFPIDNVPTSLTHLAFPLGFGNGFVGWRYPGVVWMQDINRGSDGPKWRIDVGAFEGSWNGPGSTVDSLTAGNVDFQPQLEARLRVAGKNWVAYVAGHYSKIDLAGVDGTGATPIKSEIDSNGIEVGGQWKPGPWTFKGLLYTGNGQGELFGNLSQFGDISENGGFFQAGFNFTKNWSVNGFYGQTKSSREDVVLWAPTSGKLKSRQSALSLQYASGAYQLGLEWMHDKLDSLDGPDGTKTTSGNQLSISALYSF